MTQYDPRLRHLYQLLDENGFEWLASEVRAFANEIPNSGLPKIAVAALRSKNRESSDVAAQRHPANTEDLSQATQQPQEFEACERYVQKRLEALANYLDGAMEDAASLGITSIHLGLETKKRTDLKKLKNQLTDLVDQFTDR